MTRWLNTLRVMEAPAKGRIFFMGDLHGEYGLFKEQLDAVDFRPEADCIVGCGDLVDRGPDSLLAFKLLDNPWFCSVVGNHEIMAVQYFEGELTALEYRLMGGDWFIGLPRSAQQAIVQQIKQLPVAIEVKMPEGRSIGVIHAEPPSCWQELQAEPDSIEHFIWSRRKIKSYIHGARPRGTEGIDAVVCGHTFTGSADPISFANHVYIDTGACRHLMETGSSGLTLIEGQDVLNRVLSDRE